jgi:RHS repeat-associated protein
MTPMFERKRTLFLRREQGGRNMQPNMQRAASLLAYLCCAVAATFAAVNPATAQSPDAASTISTILPSRPAITATGQSATLLPSGQWLLLGGERDGTVRGDAILYEARTKASSVLEAGMTVPRTGHTATVIPDGSVLIIGGFGTDGKLIAAIERFDPETETFELSALDLLPRTEHTATLLTDGRLLIVGGLDAEGNVRADVEILDTFTGAVERFDSLLETARSGHLAALLPSAPVLVWGGFDQEDKPVAEAELFDPQTRRFGPIDASTRGYLPDPLAALATPVVTGTHPDTAIEVSVDAVLTARFSKPLDVTTLNSDTVTLFGPHGPEAAQIVAAEAGLLLFVTPASPMTPGAVYTLFISGARDASGQAMPLAALPFRTSVLRTTAPGRHVVPLAPTTNPPSQDGLPTASGSETSGQRHGTSQPPGGESTGQSSLTRDGSDASRRAEAERQLLDDDEFWVPGPEALRGDWRSKRIAEVPKLKALKAVAELKGPEGVTAVTGHVLRLNGRPLSNVTVSMNGRVAYTDGMGRFLLTNVSPGWQRLSVDGSTANRTDAQYGRHDMRVYVTAGKTNPLVWTVWLPKLDTAHAIHVDSPTQSETVLTSPYIPGLEFRIPAGTVTRDRAGNIVTEVTITPVPIDQTAHPLPEGGFPVYFTLQPSGLRFESANGALIKPVRLRYPNYDPLLKPGDPANFWSYDPDDNGWQIYATGIVTEDNFIEMAADDSQGFRTWEDGGHSGGPPPGPPGPPCRSCPCGGGGPPGGGGGGGGGPSGPGVEPAGGDEVGDPCSVTTGQFTLASTDLSVRDLMPFDVTRVYRPNDTRTLAFGIGTSWPFAMYIGALASTSLPLVMANGSRIYFDNVNNNTGHGGVFVNSTAPGIFFGAALTIVGSPEGFTIRRKDGTLYTFDVSGNLIEIRSRAGATISITRSGTQVSRITSPSGRWLSFTYSGGLVSQIQDHTGRTVSYGYTSSRLTSVTNAAGGTWTYAYDANGRMRTVTDPRNNVMVTNTYDTNGRVATQTYADASTMQLAYTLDTNGNVTQTDVTDRSGSVRRVQLDAAGDIQQDIFPLGAPEQQTVTFTRDPTTHLLLSTTDALARRTDYTYDVNGNLLTTTRLAGTSNAVTTTYTYEPTFNQIASITDPLNRTTTFTYDSAGNLTQFTDPLNHARTMTYDPQGQLLTVTDALNNTTSYTYDTGVLATVTAPLNRTTTMFSDALGRVVRVVDPLGNATITTYDALDRVTRIANPLGNSVDFEYDANGNVTANVDQNGNRTVYTFDAMNRLIGHQDALLHSDNYTYDSSSKLKQFTDRLSQVTGYSYDGLHRRTQVGFGATPSNPTAYASTIGYTYDAGNRILAAVDSANGTITRSYDSLDRLTQEITPNGTVSYTYYANGLRQTMTVTGQPAVSYSHDNANRLTSIVQGGQTVGFSYDNANRRTQISLPNGVTINYAYDNASQLTGISYLKGATTLGDLTYTYNAAGRRTGIGGSFARTDLPAAIATTSYNANNQLAQWGAPTLSYNLNGNLTADGTYTYTWNARNQLIQVQQGATIIASHQYDAYGRRRQKMVNGSTTQFVYDGQNFVQERDGTGSVTANLLTGLGLDEIYARTKGAVTSSFLMDRLGTIIAETDADGTIQTSYSYEPYGKTTQTATVSDNSQRYTGREQDTADLYYYRARYYSSNFDRFVSEDPIGVAGGLNLYAYVNANPITVADPTGLIPCEFPPPDPPPPCRTAAGIFCAIGCGALGVVCWTVCIVASPPAFGFPVSRFQSRFESERAGS